MMVYSGKSCLKNWWLGVTPGTPIYGNHHMVYCCRTWHQGNLTSHALIQFIWIHLMVTVYNPTSLHIKLVWSLPSGKLSWPCSKMAHIYGWFKHELPWNSWWYSIVVLAHHPSCHASLWVGEILTFARDCLRSPNESSSCSWTDHSHPQGWNYGKSPLSEWRNQAMENHHV